MSVVSVTLDIKGVSPGSVFSDIAGGKEASVGKVAAGGSLSTSGAAGCRGIDAVSGETSISILCLMRGSGFGFELTSGFEDDTSAASFDEFEC